MSPLALTYLGTAMTLLEVGGLRLLTDPALDPRGSQYDFGPWYTPRSWFASEKTYETPLGTAGLGGIDAVLLSHDHHADNLDFEGRALLAGGAIRRVITTREGAARLARPARPDAEGRTHPGHGLGIAGKVTGLGWGATATVGEGASALRITATPARHGPFGTPRIHEACGFLIEPATGDGPTVFISGDTVLSPALAAFADDLRARGRRIDLAIIHCGGVCFPKLPVLGRRLFTFDATGAIALAERLDPAAIIPIHHSGWTHFRQPLDTLRAAFEASPLAPRVRFLELGERWAAPA